jgi:hypothetical protein
MSGLNEIKQQYITSALLHSKASADGDYKVANKHAHILKKIYQKIEKGNIDYTMLLELLDHDNISVRGWAGAHLLGLKKNTDKAETILQDIVEMSGKDIEENLRIFSAEMVLKTWKERGYIIF